MVGLQSVDVENGPLPMLGDYGPGLSSSDCRQTAPSAGPPVYCSLKTTAAASAAGWTLMEIGHLKRTKRNLWNNITG